MSGRTLDSVEKLSVGAAIRPRIHTRKPPRGVIEEIDMRLELHVKGIEATQRLRDYIETKLQLALGRFSHRVHDVQVRLVDVNGPKGGEDIQCHVLANLGSAGVVKIEETRVNPFQAVAHASKRVRHSLSRRLSRRRSNRRGRRELARS